MQLEQFSTSESTVSQVVRLRRYHLFIILYTFKKRSPPAHRGRWHFPLLVNASAPRPAATNLRPHRESSGDKNVQTKHMRRWDDETQELGTKWEKKNNDSRKLARLLHFLSTGAPEINASALSLTNLSVETAWNASLQCEWLHDRDPKPHQSTSIRDHVRSAYCNIFMKRNGLMLFLENSWHIMTSWCRDSPGNAWYTSSSPD